MIVLVDSCRVGVTDSQTRIRIPISHLHIPLTIPCLLWFMISLRAHTHVG